MRIPLRRMGAWVLLGMKGRTMQDNPELLLFDLGGVLVEFSGFRDLPPLLRVPRSEADIRQQWTACPTIRAFEIGQLTPPQFAERFVAAWDVAVSPAAFLQAFRSWTRGFFPGVREVLTALRGRFRLACLSNSNATHWERNAQELGLFTHFEAALSSHVLCCHKPDPLIYHRALAALHVEPEAVVFFDDVAANVEAAREVGIAAFQVAGVAELRTCLSAMGLLHGHERA